MGKIEPWVYRLPKDTMLLATTLGLPTEAFRFESRATVWGAAVGLLC